MDKEKLDTQDTDIHTITQTTDKLNYKVDKEQALALHRGGMSVPEIAKRSNCTANNIYKLIQKYKQEKNNVKSYQDNEVNIISLTKANLLSKLHPEDINNLKPETASDIKHLATAFGILTDKERLISGQSTHNYSVQTFDKSRQELHKMEQEISQLQKELTETTDK